MIGRLAGMSVSRLFIKLDFDGTDVVRFSRLDHKSIDDDGVTVDNFSETIGGTGDQRREIDFALCVGD